VSSRAGTRRFPIVRIRSEHGRRFLLSRPARFDRWFRERWGMRAALSGDPAIDAVWWAESRERELMAGLLARRDVRGALRALEAVGVVQTGAVAGGMAARLRLPRGTELDEDEHVEPIRRALRQIDAAVVDLCSTRDIPRRGVGAFRFLSTVPMLLALVVALIQLDRNFMEYTPKQLHLATALFDRSLLVGIPLGLVAIPLVGWILKGRVARADEIRLSMFTAMCVCVVAAWVGAVDLNARLDPGPVTTIEGPVTNVLPIDSGVHAGAAGVVMRAAGTREVRALFVPRDVAAGLVPDESWLVLTTGPGWLGIEHRVSVRAEPKPAAK
jgi:hypothetical protein